MRTMDRREAFKILAGAPLTAGALASCALTHRPVERNGLPVLGSEEPPRQFRGVWVATVDNIDWPSKPGLTSDQQRAEIDRTLDGAQRLELNAVLLQVRPTCDALYRSDIEPWSAFLTGRQGVGPSPDYDPLQHWVRGAHDRGLDLHAWVNPFRARHPKSIGPDAATHVSRMFPDSVRNYRGHLWLDPGSPAARELSLRVIDDLLTRYDLDGIHMDDYFYPYPDDKVPFPDEATFADYTRNGGKLDRDAWRRSNIDTFVRETQALIRRKSPHALFTISPFGIWRPNHPEGIKGFDSYAGLHADARMWLREGWCDAMIPQLYWPVASPGQPFEPLMNWWADQNTRNRHVWAGLYLTRILNRDNPATSWEPAEILDQIRIVSQSSRVTGYTLFSMIGLLENRRTIADLLAAGPLSGPALVPESPWLQATPPGAPLVAVRRTPGELELTISPAPGTPRPRRYVVASKADIGTAGWVLPGGDGMIRSTLRPRIMPGIGAELVVTPIGANGLTGVPSRTVS